MLVSILQYKQTILMLIHTQVSKFQSIKANMVCGSHQELRRSSSFERTWDESAAESVASNDVVSLVNSSAVSSKGDVNNSVSENPVAGTDMWRSKTKDSKPAKSGRLSHEEKKVGKSNNDEKKTRARKSMEFRNIKISQVSSRCIQRLYNNYFGLSYLNVDDAVG